MISFLLQANDIEYHQRLIKQETDEWGKFAISDVVPKADNCSNYTQLTTTFFGLSKEACAKNNNKCFTNEQLKVFSALKICYNFTNVTYHDIAKRGGDCGKKTMCGAQNDTDYAYCSLKQDTGNKSLVNITYSDFHKDFNITTHTPIKDIGCYINGLALSSSYASYSYLEYGTPISRLFIGFDYPCGLIDELLMVRDSVTGQYFNNFTNCSYSSLIVGEQTNPDFKQTTFTADESVVLAQNNITINMTTIQKKRTLPNKQYQYEPVYLKYSYKERDLSILSNLWSYLQTLSYSYDSYYDYQSYSSSYSSTPSSYSSTYYSSYKSSYSSYYYPYYSYTNSESYGSYYPSSYYDTSRYGSSYNTYYNGGYGGYQAYSSSYKPQPQYETYRIYYKTYSVWKQICQAVYSTVDMASIPQNFDSINIKGKILLALGCLIFVQELLFPFMATNYDPFQRRCNKMCGCCFKNANKHKSDEQLKKVLETNETFIKKFNNVNLIMLVFQYLGALVLSILILIDVNENSIYSKLEFASDNECSDGLMQISIDYAYKTYGYTRSLAIIEVIVITIILISHIVNLCCCSKFKKRYCGKKSSEKQEKHESQMNLTNIDLMKGDMTTDLSRVNISQNDMEKTFTSNDKRDKKVEPAVKGNDKNNSPSPNTSKTLQKDASKYNTQLSQKHPDAKKKAKESSIGSSGDDNKLNIRRKSKKKKVLRKNKNVAEEDGENWNIQ